MTEPTCENCAEYHDALKSLLRVVDRLLFNQPTKADYMAIEAAHELVRRDRAGHRRASPITL